MTSNITDQIRASLSARRGAWRDVADKSGVSYSWISKFMNGHIPNPGMRTLTRLKEGMRSVRPCVAPEKAGVAQESVEPSHA